MKKILLTLFALSTFALIFTSCSKKDADKNAENNQKRTIYVTAIASAKPYSFVNEDNKPDGYSIEVTKEIFKLLPQYNLVIESYTGSDGLIGTETGKYQAIIDKKFRNEEREKKYIIPNEPFGGVVYGYAYRTEDKDKFGTIDIIQKNGGKLVPMAPSNGMFAVLTEYNKAHPETAITWDMSDVIDNAAAFQWVAEKRYDIYFANKDQYDILVVAEDGALHKFANQVSWETTGVNEVWPLINKNETQLASEIEAETKTLRENGTLSKISEKWFGIDTFSFFEQN